jgi:hypothetical protein
LDFPLETGRRSARPLLLTLLARLFPLASIVRESQTLIKGSRPKRIRAGRSSKQYSESLSVIIYANVAQHLNPGFDSDGHFAALKSRTTLRLNRRQTVIQRNKSVGPLASRSLEKCHAALKSRNYGLESRSVVLDCRNSKRWLPLTPSDWR